MSYNSMTVFLYGTITCMRYPEPPTHITANAKSYSVSWCDCKSTKRAKHSSSPKLNIDSPLRNDELRKGQPHASSLDVEVTYNAIRDSYYSLPVGPPKWLRNSLSPLVDLYRMYHVGCPFLALTSHGLACILESHYCRQPYLIDRTVPIHPRVSDVNSRGKASCNWVALTCLKTALVTNPI